MADLVVMGGGMCGMLTGIVLAKDGHTVTVFERDPQEPPGDADEAWDSWERKGVNQFRMLHYLQPRFRAEIEVEVPEIAAELDALGAVRHQPTAVLPSEYTGGVRDGDERFASLTGRRPTLETALARVAAATPKLTFRRGEAVSALLTGPSVGGGIPHVVGVRTEAGEEVRADLVIDTTGRRSPILRLLDEIGARPPVEEAEDLGLVYYGRHFKSADGSIPQMRGPLLASAGTISTLTLPADNGTWGLGILAAGTDKEMRALKDTKSWEAVWRSVPVTAHWLDGEPIGDGVAVMANNPDRIRYFVIDGVPVATGVVAVADSWSCTNPAVGRGITIGLFHVLTLRDTLRDLGLDDPLAFGVGFHDATTERVEPWYRATVAIDDARGKEMVALRETGEYVSDDPQAPFVTALVNGAWRDPDLLRSFVDVGTMLATPEEVLARDGIFEAVLAQADAPDPFPGPSRAEIVALVS